MDSALFYAPTLSVILFLFRLPSDTLRRNKNPSEYLLRNARKHSVFGKCQDRVHPDEFCDRNRNIAIGSRPAEAISFHDAWSEEFVRWSTRISTNGEFE